MPTFECMSRLLHQPSDSPKRPGGRRPDDLQASDFTQIEAASAAAAVEYLASSETSYYCPNCVIWLREKGTTECRMFRVSCEVHYTYKIEEKEE